MSASLYPLVAVFLFVLPGYGLLGVLARRGDGWHFPERVGLALAVSMAIYPLLYLWAWWTGLEAGRWVVWGPGALGLAAVIGDEWRRRQRGLSGFEPERPVLAMVALLVVVALIGLTRGWAAHAMVAPAWGDSVHHTLIVQLMLEHGGLFQSWWPYAPLETFTYHPGLHANVTVWAVATGLAADRALLWGGQLFNVFAVCALYPLAYRLSGRNAWAGVLTVGVVGLISTMPGYYTNWGRYTQLGAQILLPALVWCFARLWTQKTPTETRCPETRHTGMTALALVTALLAAGLVLTHYRVAMVGAAAGLAWALWGIWCARAALRVWIRATLWAGLAALGAAILVAPWVLRLGQGHLTTVAGAISAPADSQTASDELVMWGVALDYYPLWLVVLAGASLLVALWRAPKLGVPLALWAGLTFLVGNPAILGLRGSGLVSNFLLVIGVYVLFAVPIGWFLWWVCAQLVHRVPIAVPIAGGLRFNLAGALLAVGLGLGALWGAEQQATLIDPIHEMVAAEDLAVMAWIEAEVPPDAQFLANGFLAFSDMAVVGSDAGWWLPFYTRRAVNVLPITYTMETVAPEVDKEAMRQLVLGIQAGGGDPVPLRKLLCAAGITHVYQGQRLGTYAPPAETLLPEQWLTDNADFTLLYRQGFAAVWAFDRAACGNS